VSRAGARQPATDEVAGVRLSHPDRVIYPDSGLTKRDIARYYERVEPWILPHVQGRPLTLVHCPEGIGAQCRFLKHASAWGPTALRRVKIREKTKVGEYLVADSLSAVVALAQMNIVEIHTWNSTAEDVERPNRLVWELDPGPDVSWKQTVAAARLLREVLDTLKLVSWVKTTGGRGLHVVVPIAPSLDWAACLAFAHLDLRVLAARPGGRPRLGAGYMGRAGKPAAELDAPQRRTAPTRAEDRSVG
jgi:bifunctional non-homologous end joining protein LigD